jgi:magnesium transporter
MGVVAAYVYRDGRRVREAPLDQADEIAADAGDFVWIGLVEPTEGELRGLKERYGLHPLAVEDAVTAHQLPKLDVYGDQLFVVTKTAQLQNGAICYGETDIFVGPRHIITVRHGSARSHTELREHLEAAPKLLSHGVDYVLHAVIDYIVDGYLPVIETIEEEVLEMEQRALDQFLSREEIRRLFNLRRELSRFQRLLGPMQEVVGRLEHHDLPCIDPSARPYFRDVLDHIRRVVAMVDGLREVLRTVFEVSTLIEQQRQVATTRRLAAWAAILAVPTAIAGIYGMNFAYLPELTWRYGYFVVLGVIAALCVTLFLQFRRLGWL